MMDRRHVIAAGLAAGLLSLAAPAQAQITFRAASSGPAVAFVGAGAQSNSTGTSLTPALPSGVQQGDLLIAITVSRLNGQPTWTYPSGWTLLGVRYRNIDTTADLTIEARWKVAGAAEGNPGITISSGTNGWSAQIAVYRGVDTTTPEDVTEVTADSAGAPTWVPPSITTATSGALVVSAVATNDANALAIQTAQSFTARMSGGSYDTTTGSNHAVGLADKTQATAGAVTMLTWEQTTNFTTGDQWAGITFALRPLMTALTALIIPKPAGTVQNDVMIASIAVRPNSVTITAVPSGWTPVGTEIDNNTATQNSLWIYSKVAGASEPESYTWTISANTGVTGGIQTFAGVDTTTPIDVQQGRNTPVAPDAGTIHKTPDVTTTVTNTMLVTSYGVANPGPNHWTPISTMTEAFDATGGSEAIAGYYVLQAAAGPTGVKQANSAVADSGNAHILALRPSCASVADTAYVAAAAPSGTGSVTAYWSSANPVIVLRKATAAFLPDEVPVHGTTYTAGTQPWGAGASMPFVAYDGTSGMSGVTCTATSCTNTGLTNGTIYYYKVFPKSGTCYASGIGGEISATPQAGPHPSWSYTLGGGSMLKAGIAGDGAIYTGSNAGRIVSVSTSNGTQSWSPVATTDAVQGWLTWIPISGGSNAAVIGGDWAGKVYSVNAATGATNWAVTLPGGTSEPVQAPAAAQLRVFSDATFQATHATDIVLVATRTASTTNNKLYALRASDGSVVWTFNGTESLSVDYIVGQPYVDYGRNRVYLATRAGSGAQSSLWVIDTLNGSLVVSFALGHLQTSPTLSYSGATLWVGNTSGDLYAINTATLAQKWTTPAALGSAVKGFVWEDLTTAGRLYFTTADGNVWCLQDPGAGPPPNPASPVWKTMVAGASMPLLLDSLYVGSTDGKVHELNVITGVDAKQFTLAGTVGDLSTEDSTQIFAPTSAGTIYKLPLPLP